jgi:DNA-binding MarR family transcriptional regulator
MTTPYDENILWSLRRITRAIDVYSRKLASDYHLTGPQLVCLQSLARSGPIAPSKLADSICLSHPTVTGILDRLEQRNLIFRTRLTSDRRRVDVDLTPEGKKVATIAPTPLQERFAMRFTDLPHDDQAKIDEVLRQVVEMMEPTAADLKLLEDASAVPNYKLGDLGMVNSDQGQ